MASLKSKLYLLSIFLLLITVLSCNDEDDKKSDETFTVTFSTGEGSAVASQTVTSGSKATEPSPAPTRNGYSFEAWHTIAGARFDFNTATTANVTLFAKWKAVTSTFTIVYPDITGAVNTPPTAVAPMKAPSGVTGTFSVKSGSTLPAGLVLDENTGAISGTPMASGTLNVTIEFTGTGSYVGTVETTLTITVNASRTAVNSITYLDITGAVNTPLTAVVPMKAPSEATGTFGVRPGSMLPDGLVLDENTGAISGTPNAIATTAVPIEFVGTGSYTGTVEAMVTITVNANSTAVNSIAYNAVSGVVGTMLTVTPTKAPAEATGRFSEKQGSTLPAGLVLDENTGTISGTPNAVTTMAVPIEFVGTGSYTGTVKTTVTITVDRATVNSITYLDITGAVNTPLTAVVPTKAPAVATGLFSVKSGSTLPDGLVLNPTTGAISGAPNAEAMTNVTIEFVGTGSYTGAVEDAVTITVNALRTGVGSIAYDAVSGVMGEMLTVTPTKAPATATGTFRLKSGSTLPAGLSLNASTGAISGRPNAEAMTNVTIEFVGTGSYTGTVEATFTITVKLGVNSIVYNAVSGVVGRLFIVTPTKVPAAATGTFRLKAGTTPLPSGLRLNASTGIISGTLNELGTISLTIEFVSTGSYTGTVEATLTITVNRATVNSITYPDIEGTINTLFTAVAPTKAPAAATGTFRLKAGSVLPDGLVLNSSTGAISGTPTAVATTNVTIEFVSTGSYTGTVEDAVTITVTGRAVNSIAYDDVSSPVGVAFAVTPTKNPAAATGTFRLKAGTTPLPSGLTFNENTGAVSGLLPGLGTINLTIEFVGNGSYTGTVEATLTITADRIAVYGLMYGEVFGVPNQPFRALPRKSPESMTGTFRVKSDTPLPSGLSFNGRTGVISGTPTKLETRYVEIEFVGNGLYVGTVEALVTIRIITQPDK